ncbi:hypothetical protein CLIM01_00658 [Colletotrichum limetticola]|uniref:Uncharacterized protein n=1 Tax=Colletotrichum limetticola TaxID=1209924 RepID=A0ABQ9QDS8_9PEZI|nr:hypothetical protein CLIM01_00658 [Colletotrichum limetticola]
MTLPGIKTRQSRHMPGSSRSEKRHGKKRGVWVGRGRRPRKQETREIAFLDQVKCIHKEEERGR